MRMGHAPRNCKKMGLKAPNQSITSVPISAKKVMWAPIGKDKDRNASSPVSGHVVTTMHERFQTTVNKKQDVSFCENTL